MDKNKNDCGISLKISKELRDKLNKEARELGITTSNYIRLILLNRNNTVIFGGSNDRDTSSWG